MNDHRGAVGAPDRADAGAKERAAAAGPADHVDAWVTRRAELDRRIQELHARNGQLADLLGGARDGDRAQAGSSPAQVERAEALAALAADRADEASRRAGAMRLHAAEAHERAARRREVLAESGVPDAAEQRDRARRHRQQAAADRAAAEEIERSLRMPAPAAGED